MADHLKNWLQQNKKENTEALKKIRSADSANVSSQASSSAQLPSSHQVVDSQAVPVSILQGGNDPAKTINQQLQTDPIPSTSGLQSQNDPIPSTSGIQATNQSLLQQNLHANINVTNPSDLVFENNSLKMTILRAAHLQEKKFKALAKFISLMFSKTCNLNLQARKTAMLTI